jgi:PAS domain S-box-containing protein
MAALSFAIGAACALLVHHLLRHKRSSSVPNLNPRQPLDLLEHQAALVLELDRDGQVRYANPAFAQALGRGRESVRGEPVSAVIAPEDCDSLRAALARTLDTRETTHCRTRLLKGARAGPRLVAWTLRPMCDRPAEPADTVVAAGTDITDQQAAVEELRRGQSLFEACFRAYPNPGCVLGLDGSVLRTNPAFDRIRGDLALDLPHAWKELVHPEDRTRAEMLFTPVLAGRATAADADVRVLLPGERTQEAGLSLNALAGPDDRIEGAILTVRDATSERRAAGFLRLATRLLLKLNESESLASAGPEILESLCIALGTENGVLRSHHHEVCRPVALYGSTQALARENCPACTTLRGVVTNCHLPCVESESPGLAVPLRAAGEHRGILWIGNPRERSIGPEEIDLLRTIASGLAILDLRQEDRAALRHSAARFALQNRISRGFLTATPDRIPAQLLQVLSEHWNARYAAFGELAGTDTLRVCSLRASPDTGEEVGQCLNSTLSVHDLAPDWQEALDSRKGLVTTGALPVPVPNADVQYPGGMIAPLVCGTDLLGVIALAGMAPAPGIDDLRELELALTQTAPVLLANRQRREHEAEHARLALAVEQIRDGVVIMDTGGLIQYVNSVVPASSGQPRERLIGSHFDCLVGATDVPAPIWSVLESGGVWEGTWLTAKADGHSVWEEVKISPLRDGEGRTVQYVSVQRDISYRRHLERQLEEGRRMEALGRLAGGIAHDFNNLLQSVEGYATLIADRATRDPTIEHYVESIQKAVDRGTLLASHLLAFGERDLFQPKAVDLNRVVGAMAGILRRTLGDNIRLWLLTAQEIPPVNGDVGQLHQVLMNLCLNARDAMPRGGRLTIETSVVTVMERELPEHPAERPGPHLLLTVSDTGTGIAPGIRDRVFEPFFTTKNGSEATGLGLSAVYGIVRKHGGGVDVISEPGTGTTVRVFLPAAEEDTTSRRAGKDIIPNAPDQDLNRRVLLAEDEELVREVAEIMLTEAGYEVMIAEDGDEARQMVEADGFHVDLAVLDVMMPGCSGREVAEVIWERRPETPVLFATGYSDRHLPDDMSDLGGYQTVILRKPYTRAELLQAVSALLCAQAQPGSS